MTDVMSGKEKLLSPVAPGRELLEILLKEASQEQFFLEPEGNCRAERSESTRHEGQVGFQQALKFEEWLVIEDDMIQLTGFNPGLLQAVCNGAVRETGIMLYARKALFLCGGNDITITNERSGTVMVKS